MRAKHQIKTLANFGLPIFWMGIIFYFSAQEGSGHQYYDLLMFIERKGAHVFEYFVLTLLWIQTFRYSKIPLAKSFLYALVVSFTYAASDEFHQLFVFGREGKISDVGIDLIGITLALLFFRVLVGFRKKRQ